MMHHWMIAVSSDQTCLTHIGVAAIVSAAICVVVDIVRKKLPFIVGQTFFALPLLLGAVLLALFAAKWPLMLGALLG